MTEYKQGDRVRLKNDVDGGRYGRAGCTGTVIGYQGAWVHVEYDTFRRDDESRWFALPRDLEQISTFFPGDRIKLRKHSGFCAAGDEGKVISAEDGFVHALMDAKPLYGIGFAILPEALVEVVSRAADCAGRNGQQEEERAATRPKFKAGDVVKHRSDDVLLYTVSDVREDGCLYFAKYPTAGYWAPDFYSLVLSAPAVTSSPAIVALVKDGKPRPSQWPHVHTTVNAATAEAERLARANPGQEFAVYQRVAGRKAEVTYNMKEVA